ncbi:hypothetical protein RPMA_16965 [Tardiphaga alba]|uniref:Uncharacterized protein n=1 Tax=Tardiphaga alba TaxID=340268 RepID=A0ABX8AD45_9BRAD|nr:hypothetical protein [Tardiphaga alba]QUS40338.1 hypothetical protein RPMA_16965 [Tardiphaga alba]
MIEVLSHMRMKAFDVFGRFAHGKLVETIQSPAGQTRTMVIDSADGRTVVNSEPLFGNAEGTLALLGTIGPVAISAKQD